MPPLQIQRHDDPRIRSLHLVPSGAFVFSGEERMTYKRIMVHAAIISFGVAVYRLGIGMFCSSPPTWSGCWATPHTYSTIFVVALIVGFIAVVEAIEP